MTVDCVVKLGGSLLADLDKLAQFLPKISTTNLTCVFTVGSGPLGDAYKAFNYEARTGMPFDLYVECWSAVQSINARLLASINDSFTLCRDIAQIERLADAGLRPVLDAKDFADLFKSLQHQMSDVRSALITHLLDCPRLVIFTDVDGVYTGDPRTDPLARKLDAIAASDPLLHTRTSVDVGLAEHLTAYGITAYVVGIDGYLESDLEFEDYVTSRASVIKPAAQEVAASWISSR